MYIIRKLYNSTKWSIAGLAYAFKYELAFRLDVLLAVVLTPVAFFIATNLLQLTILLLSLHLLLIVELLNTAIEAVVDRISTDLHDLSKCAKDAASAAVFYALLLAIVVWSIIIYNNFFS